MDIRNPNDAIIIIPDDKSCKGSGFKNPIEIDDDVEFLGMTEISRGRNPNMPIIVEQEGLHRISCSSFIGSKRCRSFNPVIEIGESSGLTQKEKLEALLLQIDYNCEICTESKYRNELFAINGCSHTYCKSCISQYVAGKVEENVFFIKCPDPNCTTGKIEPDMCSLIVEEGVFDLWCKGLCELMVNDKFYCPFKNCSALMIYDKNEEIIDAECPHCCRLFCAQCKVPWHAGFTCSEFQNLGEDERKNEDLILMKLAQKNKWQRCPRCKFFVERIDGCVFITCRCRFTFCYGCGSEMKVNHYCEKCQR